MRCLHLADAAKAAAQLQGENLDVVANRAAPVALDEDDDADVVVIEARHASRSAEMLARAAAHLEDDYLSQSEYASWTRSVAVCAALSSSVDDRRRATGAW
jgi:hypothetical protein